MSDWSPEELAEESGRRDALQAAGWCPDSGLTIRRCAATVCDCGYDWLDDDELPPEPNDAPTWDDGEWTEEQPDPETAKLIDRLIDRLKIRLRPADKPLTY